MELLTHLTEVTQALILYPIAIGVSLPVAFYVLSKL